MAEYDDDLAAMGADALKAEVLKLRDDDGRWDDGWLVEQAGSHRLGEAQLPDWHKEIKRHRKATGDSDPKPS